MLMEEQMRDHTRLKAFQLADRLVFAIYSVTRRFPQDERYALASQMRRAAVSVGANIVEASARGSDQDFARMLSIAYSSAKELQYEISIAARLGYMSSESKSELERCSLETCKALWALIRAVKKG